MCKNKNLKESLQSLSQSTYSLYEKELPLDDRFRNDSLAVVMALSKTDPKVIEIPEFRVCLSLMTEDEKIKALQGKLVGTYSGAVVVENEDACILGFLKQLYLESEKYDQGIFDKKYLSFEEFFYSDHLIFKDSANLFNFSSDNSELVLGHEITIRKMEESRSWFDNYTERNHFSYREISKSSYAIERNYETKKIVGRIPSQDQSKTINELSKTDDLFDLVIDSLRVLKSSAVYRDHWIKTENITFHPHGLGGTRAPFFENLVVGEKCNIAASDIAMLCKVFDFLCSEKDSRFDVARRRLSLGIERKTPEDRLIDYMIGLEALYLPDGSAELSFRLSVRVAFLLSSGTGKKDTFDFLRKMYDVRSSIVHGNKYDLNAEDINKLEELLRKSVILWIEDKNNFATAQLNKILFDA